MKKIVVSGVPEHFNLPWKQAIAAGDFGRRGIDLQWQDVPEGTGKLCELLRSGQTDMAVILTEGIVRDIVLGNPSKIVQVYVQSPLLWGIHVAADAPFMADTDLRGKKAAVSRLGSGSHLMAYVHAASLGWPAAELSFEIVNTIDGAVTALQQKSADYFMWEQFMTQPLVDEGIFRRTGVCPTPWPSFVIAARNEFTAESRVWETVCEVVNAKAKMFKESSETPDLIAQTFGQKPGDAASWLSVTHWSGEPISEAVLNNVQNQLSRLGLIDKKGIFTDIALV